MDCLDRMRRQWPCLTLRQGSVDFLSPPKFSRRRYDRGLANLFDLYIPIVTTVYVYDGASFPSVPIVEGRVALIDTGCLANVKWALLPV